MQYNFVIVLRSSRRSKRKTESSWRRRSLRTAPWLPSRARFKAVSSFTCAFKLTSNTVNIWLVAVPISSLQYTATLTTYASEHTCAIAHMQTLTHGSVTATNKFEKAWWVKKLEARVYSSLVQRFMIAIKYFDFILQYMYFTCTDWSTYEYFLNR